MERRRLPPIKALFDEVLEIEEDLERRAFLDRLGARAPKLQREVEELLRAYEAAGSFLEPRSVAGLPDVSGGITERSGTMIGPYRLLERIGEGGFGVVFLAEQEVPVRRRVALKVVKPGMDSKQVIARFEAERQALALMEHPNIARVFDAGTTSTGRPYFVMELIKGIPITEYCDQCELSIRERVALFVQVCRGIQHAHHRGIIHRDIKPSNVLVAIQDGSPAAKVIDFGVAKAVHGKPAERAHSTGFAQVLGTPLYMSPEQAEMSPLELDTRTDIYSLGVVLYELLTGTTPFEEGQLGEASFDEVRRVIRCIDPPTPSSRISTLGQRAPAVAAQRRVDPRKLFQSVRGELDWIVMRALEKDRSRRYESAGALAADVERYLRGDPVEASPPSIVYGLKKLAGRHRAALVVTASVVLAVLALGGSLAWVHRDRAIQRAALEAEVVAALDEGAADYRRGRIAQALGAVERAEALLASRGGAGDLLARVRSRRSELEVAASLETIRLEEVTETKGGFDWKRADGAYRDAFQRSGLDLEALEPVAAAERIRGSAIAGELLDGLDSWLLAKMKAKLSAVEALFAVARLADADPWRRRLREALERRDVDELTTLASDPEITDRSPATVELLAHALARVEERERAVLLLREMQRKHPGDFWINARLGALLEDAHPEQAAGFYRAALALRPESAGMHLSLGNALADQGETAEAIATFRRGIVLHPDEAKLHQNLAVVLARAGETGEALAALERAVLLDPDDAKAHYNLAGIFSAQGKRAQALAALERATALDPELARAHYQLGNMYLDRREYERAEPALRRATELEPSDARSYRALGFCLSVLGRSSEAVAAYEKAIALAPDDARSYYNLGVALQSAGRLEEAAARYEKAIELDPGPGSVKASINLGGILRIQGKLSEARAAFQQAADRDPESYEAHHNLGTLSSDLGDLAAAIRALRRAVELRPNSASSRSGLGSVLGRKGDLGAARVELEKALALDPGDARAHENLGVVLKLEGRLGDAIAAFRRAIERRPDHAGAHANLAVVLQEAGDVDGALEAFERAIALAPEEPEYPNGLGTVLRRKGRFEEAAAAYRRAIELAPGLAKAHYNLANVTGKLGNTDEAIRLYHEAIRLEPQFAEAHLNLGHALRERGEFAESLLAFRRVHDLGKSDPRWTVPSGELVAECEKLVELERRLPGVVSGADSPADALEWTAFADVSYRKRRFDEATRLLERAFAEDPDLAEDPALGHRYNAACYAVLAGTGEGLDGGALDEDARARRRRQAREWLAADLAAHRNQLEERRASAEALLRVLRHWRHDRDLKGIRDEQFLRNLSDAERKACRELWRDLEELIERAEGEGESS